MADRTDAGTRTNRATDPLEPLIAVTRVVGILVVAAIVFSVLAVLFGRGHVLTIGENELCTTVEAGFEVPTGEADVSGWNLAPGVGVEAHSYQLCRSRPGAAAHLYGVLATEPGTVLLLGFLAGVLLLVRRARRAGLFSREVTRVTHWLGWWLLAGEVVVFLVESLAHSALVGQMFRPEAFEYAFTGEISFATLLAGAGVLTIARVLRISVAMQEDLDGTI